jgi:hypothetical protein
MSAVKMQTPGQLAEPGVMTNLRFSCIFGIVATNHRQILAPASWFDLSIKSAH